MCDTTLPYECRRTVVFKSSKPSTTIVFVSLRVNAATPPVTLMLDSRAAPDKRDNGSTVTFNIPNGVNALTETKLQFYNYLNFKQVIRFIILIKQIIN